MDVFTDKYFVFIVSAGRTGTKFFGDMFARMVNDSFSAHEPDVLMDFKFKSFRQIKQFGLYRLVWGKILGKTGIRNLSQNYLAKKLDRPQLVAALIKHRERYYNDIDQELIFEAYSGWFGAIEGIQSLYKNYKVVGMSRDPRNWVKSNMDWGTMYGKRDWIGRLKLGRLNPEMIKDAAYAKEWARFNRFQKLCWAWKTIYETMLDAMADDPNAIIIKFEDIFRSEEKYTHLSNLLNFVTKFPDRVFGYQIPENILERRLNVNIAYEFPSWERWDRQMKTELRRICGEPAIRLGYDLNTSSNNAL
jgi:hypothetical protein